MATENPPEFQGTPEPSTEVAESSNEPCNMVVAGLVLVLLAVIVAAVVAGTPGDNQSTSQTHNNSSIDPSGIGGRDSLDNPWD